MMRMHHNRPLPSSGRPHNKNGSEDGDIGANGGRRGGYGPISHDGSYREEREEEGGGGGGHGGFSAARTLQPLSTTDLESPAGMMAASLRFPFTSAQWQELERQALIYKYMMASAPVPPDLLTPICRHFSDTAAAPHSTLGRSSCFNLRFSSGMDPEPGRCRRTDGKKWRCSRDAAPDQKYCERHMHRGRPRSRKPVEVHLRADINNIDGNNKRSAPITPPETASPCLSNNFSSNNITSNHQLSGFLCRSDVKASPFDNLLPLASYKEPRGVDWMMRGETIPNASSNQQWPQLIYSKANGSAFRQHYEGESSLNYFSNFGPGVGSEAAHQNDQCFLFLNPDIASLGEPSSFEQRRTPKEFIDAWSAPVRPNTGHSSAICLDEKLPRSALTLSMPGVNVSNEDSDQIQMGLGINASSSWTSSPLGGPLAEVLRPSVAHGCSGGSRGCGKSSSCGGGGLNLMSVGWGTSCDTAGSPGTTTVSSPSEVLQQTLASVSDGSGNSSPAFNSAAAMSDFAF